MPKIPTLTFNNGFKIPVFGLGTWNSPPGVVKQAVKDAIDAGYRHFDCAHVYENEHEIGSALAEKFSDGSVKREDLFITTKLWNAFHNPSSVPRALEVSLKNLQLNYVDLYLIHWPMSYKEDGEKLFPLENGEFIDGGVDLDLTWKAMEDLIETGKVKSIGVSNFNARQIDRVLKIGRIVPVCNQVECHPYLSQRRLKAHCEAKKIHITAYSPLGSPARPWAEKGELILVEDPVIVKIAAAHKKTPAQVLIRYQIQLGNVVIPKTVTKERIYSNIQVFDFTLSDAEMKEIDGLDCHRRICPETAAIKHRDHPFAHDEF